MMNGMAERLGHGRGGGDPIGRTLALALLLTGLAHAAPASAQVLLDRVEVPPRPLELILDHREALGLTLEQTRGIGRIRERLAQANEPLVARMMALRQQWRQQRHAEQQGEPGTADALGRIRSEAASVTLRIRRNNRLAMQAVNRLLTADQRAALRAIVEERRGSRGARDRERAHAENGH